MTARRALTHQLRPTLAAAAAVTLTAFALSPTLADGPWFMATLLVIGTVAVVGGAGRGLSLPGWAVVALQGLALLMLLTVLFAADVARFGLLPGTEAWRMFIDLANEGGVVVEQEVAPVTVTDGVRFLVVAGVALIAWAVDAVAVTGRRAALAGIPLLALYLVPATVLPDGVPWPLFVAAGVGWLLLLLEDGRLELSRWGRPIEGGTGGRVHSVGGTGRRLGAAALTVAVIVPVILPSLDDGRFGGGAGDGSGGSGAGDASDSQQRVLTVNPITDLQRNLTQAEDTVVLYYTTTAPTPEYLRIATLDRFDGESWNLEEMQAGSDQQAARGLPTPPGLTEEITRSVVDYDIAVGPLDTPRLPLPYPASVVDIEGDWRWDADSFDVFSAEENGSALDQSYTASVLALSPTVEQLRAAAPPDGLLNPMTDLPEEVEQRLTPLAATVTGDATTDYDRALALQNWFRTEFDYSLDTVEGNSATALDSFLRDRSGYCEQFAATMALMARTLDIPSRVQVGFTPGEVTQDAELADGDIWVVSAHDAHAWPELWFAGVGWVRFEPTPGGGDGGATPGYAPVPQEEDQTRPGDRGDREGGGIVCRRGGCPSGDRGQRPPDLRDVLEANRGRDGVGDASSLTESDEGSGSAALMWLALGAALAAGVAAPKVASLTVRRARWRRVDAVPAAVPAAWADVLDAATDVDLPALATETPRDLAARIPTRGGLRAGRADELRQLAGWVELVRYRGSVDDVPSVLELRQLSDGIRAELLGALSPRDRRRATWWPTSGRLSLLAAWNGATEGLAVWWQRVTSRAASTARRRGDAPSAPRSAS